ncbi:pre-mRNA-processing factor 17 [Branchiostoma belcheri]|nr:pre-mRNA-processing factor 17 [Branchiostoma belcheri]
METGLDIRMEKDSPTVRVTCRPQGSLVTGGRAQGAVGNPRLPPRRVPAKLSFAGTRRGGSWLLLGQEGTIKTRWLQTRDRELSDLVHNVYSRENRDGTNEEVSISGPEQNFRAHFLRQWSLEMAGPSGVPVADLVSPPAPISFDFLSHLAGTLRALSTSRTEAGVTVVETPASLYGQFRAEITQGSAGFTNRPCGGSVCLGRGLINLFTGHLWAVRHGERICWQDSPMEEIPLQPWADPDRSLRGEVDRFFNFISSPQYLKRPVYITTPRHISPADCCEVCRIRLKIVRLDGFNIRHDERPSARCDVAWQRWNLNVSGDFRAKFRTG